MNRHFPIPRLTQSATDSIFESGIDIFTAISMILITVTFLYVEGFRNADRAMSTQLDIVPVEVEYAQLHDVGVQLDMNALYLLVRKNDQMDVIVEMARGSSRELCVGMAEYHGIRSCLQEELGAEIAADNENRPEIYLIDERNASNTYRLAVLDFLTDTGNRFHTARGPESQVETRGKR